MEEEITNGKPVLSTSNWPHAKLLFATAVVLISVLSFWAGMQAVKMQCSGEKTGNARTMTNNVVNSITATKPDPGPTVSPKSDAEIMKQPPIQEIEDPFGSKYYVKIWGPIEIDVTKKQCFLKVYDGLDKEIEIQDIIEGNRIGCVEGMGNFESDFVGWATDAHFVLKKDSALAKVSIKDSKLEFYAHKPGNTDWFVGVDKEMDYWLFRKFGENQPMIFEMRNAKGGLVKTITYPEQKDGYSTVMYDEVNNGYLFVTEGLDEQATKEAQSEGENTGNGMFWTKFDFLQLPGMNMKTLLKTDPAALGGRGCYRETLESEPGVVIIKMNDAPCILLDNKYWEKDGTVRLKI